MKVHIFCSLSDQVTLQYIWISFQLRSKLNAINSCKIPKSLWIKLICYLRVSFVILVHSSLICFFFCKSMIYNFYFSVAYLSLAQRIRGTHNNVELNSVGQNGYTVSLFVLGLRSNSRIYRLYGNVTIDGKGLNLSLYAMYVKINEAYFSHVSDYLSLIHPQDKTVGDIS